MRGLLKRALVAAAIALLPMAAFAGQWPGKPARFMVPHPPDGYTFLFAFDQHGVNPSGRSDEAGDKQPGTAPAIHH